MANQSTTTLFMISLDSFDYQHEKSDSFIGAVPLTSGSTASLLNDLINHAEGRRFVFDLDSTLLNNRPRNAAIMQEFGSVHGVPTLMDATAEHFQDWSARNAMTAIGLTTHEVEQHIDSYQDYWYERFFTSDYCEHDIVVPESAEFVAALIDGGGVVNYLTGRHEGMREGTAASLSKLSFPAPSAERVKLLMKPRLEGSDDLFKVETLKKLEIEGPVFAAFDNEPTHINSYRTAFPNAVCVHLMTDHSMREVELLDNIVSIVDFIR